jgi:hypothetical protein
MSRPQINIAAVGDDEMVGPAREQGPPPPPVLGDDGPDHDLGVLGAQAAPEPVTPEDAAASIDASLAAQFRQRLTEARKVKTHEFPIPTVPGMILVARPFRDFRAYAQGVKLESFVVRSTADIILVDDDNERHSIGGWGPRLKQIMGLPGITKSSDLVTAVFSDEEGFLPVAFDTFVAGLREWMSGATAQGEEDLGE